MAPRDELFLTKLKCAPVMKREKVINKHYTVTKTIDANSGYESFTATIDGLKKGAAADTIVLTNADISAAMGITGEQFDEYWRTDKALENVFMQLRTIYKDYLKVSYHQIQFTVEHEDPYFESLKRKRAAKSRKRKP